MRKTLQIVFGGVFMAIGAIMLVVVLRDSAPGQMGQAAIGPLALLGAGALAISGARRKPKKW